jgi:hypothetical protein
MLLPMCNRFYEKWKFFALRAVADRLSNVTESVESIWMTVLAPICFISGNTAMGGAVS